MKAINILILTISLAISVQATRLRSQGSPFYAVTTIEHLKEGNNYMIGNNHYGIYLGPSAYGYLYSRDSGEWKITASGGGKYYLKNENNSFLQISNSGSTSTTTYLIPKLYLTNGVGGICISKNANSLYLRMYYKYQFPFGVYRTNTASSCGAWEKFTFYTYQKNG